MTVCKYCVYQEFAKNYLTETKILDWKYENAVKQILDLEFQPNEVEIDLKKLGVIYKSLVNDMKDEHSATFSKDELKKVTNIIENMEFLATAAPIKKLLKEKKWQVEYKQNLEDNVLDAREEERKKENKKTAEEKFNTVSASEKFAHLAKFYGDDGVLDLQKANLPKRFYKHLRKMKDESELLLQPIINLEEREMLVDISNCQNTSDIQKLLSTWYSKSLSSNCKFIRFALDTFKCCIHVCIQHE